MTTYNTRNPLGSPAPKDLFDNAQNLDHRENDRERETWPDRFGVQRLTWLGIERNAERQRSQIEQRFAHFLASSGYQDIGDYAPGLEITERNQIFWRDGELYRAGAALALPYTATGMWSEEGGLFVAVGDAALRQQLAEPIQGGGELVGWQRRPLADAVLTVGSFLSAQAINLWEFAQFADRSAGIAPELWDWSDALQAAINLIVALAESKNSVNGLPRIEIPGGL